MSRNRRMPVGAEVLGDGRTEFRVWAPRRQRVEVIFDRDSQSVVALAAEQDGYHSGVVSDVGPGMRYWLHLDAEPNKYPDPVTRFQPEGPHGPSEIVDPASFAWTDTNWPGVTLTGQVIYEMHIGTFTPAGTWAAAIEQLPELAKLGVTVLEIMPVADFPGRFGWGYDGVSMFAPSRLYGTPDEFRQFVDRAHAVGLGVILDVVYNHFGPDGNYVRQFSEDYFSKRYKNEWGDPLNFDGPNSAPVREFFISNAGYWIDEFHLDGLRLDATQQIFDSSKEHVVMAIARHARQRAHPRKIILVAENESQQTKLVRDPERGGYGLDMVWNDDLHHSAMVALTGQNEAYYTDYLGNPQEFISGVKWGYLYQGQRYKWQKQRRGTPGLDLAPAHFVTFIQNHDQVANTGRGLRCHHLTSPGRYRAFTALLLLAPGTPMLFQGQEFASSSPFLYFADHDRELADAVFTGRRKFLTQFPSLALREMQESLADPADIRTFQMCKLDLHERERNAKVYLMHCDLLRLRKSDPAFSAQRYRGVDGAVLAPQAFVLRFFVDGGADRLLLVNYGRDLHLDPAPEPLLAPPPKARWATLWSSEDIRYGGHGTPSVDSKLNWRVPAEAAVAMHPVAAK